MHFSSGGCWSLELNYRRERLILTSLHCYKVCTSLYTKYTYQRDFINMNNFKGIIIKGRIQISIYILVQYYECVYYLILLQIFIFYNKRVFKCKITYSPYSSTPLKCKALRLKESKGKQ